MSQDAHKSSSVCVTRLLLLFDFFSYILGIFSFVVGLEMSQSSIILAN